MSLLYQGGGRRAQISILGQIVLDARMLRRVVRATPRVCSEGRGGPAI